MFYALIYYPEIKNKIIDVIRNQYDPHAHLIKEHITLIFPVPDIIGEEKLVEHIEDVLSKWEPFKIHITGYGKTWDHWLYLKIKEGKGELMNLHDELYSGNLDLYLRENLPYKPRIGLGVFTKEGYDPLHPEKLSFDEAAYQEAENKLAQEALSLQRIMNQLVLVKINDEFSKLWEVNTFFLG
ncbi:MAG: 2'-5' RNA ligase family protein [Bacteroidales bacterium]